MHLPFIIQVRTSLHRYGNTCCVLARVFRFHRKIKERRAFSQLVANNKLQPHMSINCHCSQFPKILRSQLCYCISIFNLFLGCHPDSRISPPLFTGKLCDTCVYACLRPNFRRDVLYICNFFFFLTCSRFFSISLNRQILITSRSYDKLPI